MLHLHIYTHTYRHIHTSTSEGLCKAIPKSCSSFLSSSSVVGIPWLLCRSQMSNLHRTTRCHHLDHVLMVLQKPSCSRVNSQPRARCSKLGKRARQVHSRYLHAPQRATTRATQGTTWPSSGRTSCPIAPVQDQLPPTSVLNFAFCNARSSQRAGGHRAMAPASHHAAAGTSGELAAAASKKMRRQSHLLYRFVYKLSARFGRQQQRAGTRREWRR